MSKVALLTEDELREMNREAANVAAVAAVQTYCKLVQLSPTEPLSIRNLATEYDVDPQTLFSRIKDRHIPTVPYKNSKKTLAILPQHLYELLKK